ncbi:MAG: hypothetical protein AB1Z65_12245 [Candidatus Sulfomarinibacteraceae bacterium]
MEGISSNGIRRDWLCAAVLAAAVVGCGPPTLDVSTTTTAERTARKMRKPMTEVESTAFDEALFYLAGMPWLGKDQEGASVGDGDLEILIPLDGRTSEGIVAEARRRRLGEIRAGLTALEELQRGSAAAVRDLEAFRFSEARVFKRNRDYLEWPVIEFRLDNGTNHFVSMVSFRAVLLKPGDHRPWLVEDFELVFFDGIAPGEKERRRIEPEQQEWIQLVDPHPDLEFVIEARRLVAVGGRLLSSTEWGVVEARKLASYERTLRQVRGSDSLALDQPPLPSLPPLALETIVRADFDPAREE